jgi:hypothetical protein
VTPARKPATFIIVLGVLILVATLSLALSVMNAIRQDDLESERAADRLEADLISCERGNETRVALRMSAQANEAMWAGIRDDLFPFDSPRRVQLNARLIKLREANSQLQGPIDCRAVTPGAKEDK